MYLFAFVLIITCFFFFIKIIKRLSNNQIQLTFLGNSLAIIFLLQDLFDRMYHIILLGDPINRNLPLHVCGISGILVAFLLLTRKQVFFDFVYFFGLSGAIPAVLTPDLSFKWPHPLFITYFFSHYFIFFGIFYAVKVYNLRPNFKSLKNALLMIHVYAIFIFVINFVIDSNYLFLRNKPDSSSLMDLLGPWPWYIFWIEVITIGAFILLYLPFHFYPNSSR